MASNNADAVHESNVIVNGSVDNAETVAPNVVSSNTIALNATTDNSILADFSTPMFQSIDPQFDSQQSNVDLDDLFRECYFMEFNLPSLTSNVPSSASSTDGLVDFNESAAAGAASLIHDSSFPSETQSSAPATNITTTSALATATPITVVSSSGSNQTATATPIVSSSSLTTNKKKREASASLDAEDDDGGEELTDQQRLERRERNREHAKRSRLRKKFLLESLQEQIQGLQEQIDAFKNFLQQEVPNKADEIIQTICGDKGKFTPLPMPSGFGPVKTLMEPDFRLMSALSGSQQNFAISDPSLPDNPIVYVSQGFLELTGYKLDQVLGRNCRFLQGPGTDQSAVEVIRRGINEGVDTSVCLLNYKADGTPFWNQFFVAALRDAENNVVNFVGVQCEVSKAVVEKHLGERASNTKK